MIDTLVIMFFICSDTLENENRFENEFAKADRAFDIEMMRLASEEAAEEAFNKTYKEYLKIIGIKDED